jgi:hypothetical protein
MNLPIEKLLSRLNAKRSGKDWTARCPAHDDSKASLSISEAENGSVLMHCFAGCTAQSIVDALGLTMKDLFPAKPARRSKPQIVCTYDYVDRRGKLLYQTVRFQLKDFKQRRPNPFTPGVWIWNLKGVPRVLYRLPEVKAAVEGGQCIYIAEGEKDVDELVKQGFAATCNPLGAKRDGSTWARAYTKTLRGAAKVIIIADKDEIGRRHAGVIATELHRVVKSIKVIELPDRGANKVKDAYDFFAAGGSAEEVRALVDAPPEFVPELEPQPRNPDCAVRESLDDSEEQNEGTPRKSVATRLLELANDFTFFHDPHDRGFVRLTVNRHVEIWQLNSSQFRKLLAQAFYKQTGSVANRNALADAISTLEGRSLFDSPEEPVFLRIAAHGENILIDLSDPQWRVVEVTPAGWRILNESPVAFIRTPAMRPLPLPATASKGSLEPLWQLVNVTSAQRPLVAGALVNGFHPHGPYFATNYVGEQGSAKSCIAKIHRLSIDPNETPLRSPPREERDLIVHAANNWIVALDNLSRLPDWQSDGICRLVTGGGHSARQLYTDGEEFSLSVKRPVILNGIEDVAARPDLAERALQIELETIPDDRRISEKELWRKFEEARPVIFSGLLNGLACALRELPNVKVDSLPRMADAALFATAAETAFGWERGTFITAYTNNLNEGAIASVDAHPVGLTIRQLLEGAPEWIGEPTELLKALNGCAADEIKRSRNWPQNARAVSACLRRLAQAFRRSGIELEFAHGKRRTIRLCKRVELASPASPHNVTSETSDANDANLQPLYDKKPAESLELIEELV